MIIIVWWTLEEIPGNFHTTTRLNRKALDWMEANGIDFVGSLKGKNIKISAESNDGFFILQQQQQQQ